MTPRERLLRRVDAALGRRSLVWAGIRGDDIEPLADVPQLESAFSIIGRYSNRAHVSGVAFEDMSGRRVDLEVWDIEDHLHDPNAQEFRRAILASLAGESALLPYRPSRFLSAISFARQDRCLNLGLFGAQQSAFEHKPWVESSVARLDVPTIGWTYIADEEQLTSLDLLKRGPVVLRRSRTSGGEGIVLVEDDESLAAHWPMSDEGFVSVAPYVEDGIPVNVGATVWPAAVSVHHASVQIIGVPDLVNRRFGYAGNDFAAIGDLAQDVLEQIESSTRKIGAWLREAGYRGTFGVDFLVKDGIALFTEVNPRFQGSTHASCRLDIEADRPCLMLEQMAVMLGIDAPGDASPPTLAELAADAEPLSNVVVHHTAGAMVLGMNTAALIDRIEDHTPVDRADVLVGPEVAVERGAAVARLALRSQVTTTGYDLTPALAAAVRGWAMSGHGTITMNDHDE